MYDAMFKTFGILLINPGLQIWVPKRNGMLIGHGRYVGESRIGLPSRRGWVSEHVVGDMERAGMLVQINQSSDAEAHFAAKFELAQNHAIDAIAHVQKTRSRKAK